MENFDEEESRDTKSDDGILYEPESDNKNAEDDFSERKHITQFSFREVIVLQRIVADEIRPFIDVNNFKTTDKRSRSRSKTRRANNNVVYDLPSEKISEGYLEGDIKVSVPNWMKSTCTYLRQDKNIKLQGIFRKEGSVKRKNELVKRLKEGDGALFISEDESTYDVCTALKQLLRDMPEPLIPYESQEMFLECLNIEGKYLNEILTSLILLLPFSHIQMLAYLMEFFKEVAANNGDNQMGFSNLAKIITPNIMPPIDVSLARDYHDAEKLNLENHIKIVELLILNANTIGYVTTKYLNLLQLERYCYSEDDLDNVDCGERKKRRSGSVTRYLDIIKRKVGLSKGVDNFSTPSSEKILSTPGGGLTPGNYLHTPIIVAGSTKKKKDEHQFSQRKKKAILDGVAKKNTQIIEVNSTKSATPFTMLACPSPLISLDPSPMSLEWKTPSKGFVKNFVTPSLLRKRIKPNPETDKQALSAPQKSLNKMKVFGRKAGKKQNLDALPSLPFLPKLKAELAKLFASPRVFKIENESCPSNSKHRKFRKSLSSDALLMKSEKFQNEHNLSNSNISIPASFKNPSKSKNNLEIITNNFTSQRENSKLKLVPGELSKTNASEGEYVRLNPKATSDDIRNEAFISSSLSLSNNSNISNENNDKKSTSSNKEKDDEEKIIKIEPLLRDINILKRNAELDFLDPLPKFDIKEKKEKVSEEPLSKTIESVEKRLLRTEREAKIIQIRGQNSFKIVNRRFSFQEKGISPSQRRIRSFRRRSHEPAKSLPVLQFITPKSNEKTFPLGKLSRSPINLNRCTTLRRGRPNTYQNQRGGLTKPASVPAKEKDDDDDDDEEENESSPTAVRDAFPTSCITPLRRMSSVQELVRLLEAKKRGVKLPQKDYVKKLRFDTEVTPISEKPASRPLPSLPVESNDGFEEDDEFEWTSGLNFNFNGNKTPKTPRDGNRDSIQVLKNAGKVSANIKLFDGLVKKSPHKSLIPRLTALQNSRSSLGILSPSPEKISEPNAQLQIATMQKNKSKNCVIPIPPKMGHNQNKIANNNNLEGRQAQQMSRRFSSIDVYKQKQEKLLDNIKKEVTVKRSATTTNSSTNYIKRNRDNIKFQQQKLKNSPMKFNKSNAAKENSPAPCSANDIGSLEDIMRKEMDTRFAETSSSSGALKKKVPSSERIKRDPLKTKVIVSVKKKSPNIIRSVSDREAYCNSTPLTPKIKKHLTVGPTDYKGNQTPRKHLRGRHENEASSITNPKTPLKAIHFN